MYFREFKYRDGSKGVIIFTGKTQNAKTGDIVQTWILRQDRDPVACIKMGYDKSYCGDCVRRPALRTKRPEGLHGCYVTCHRAPLAVWRAYKRGSYKNIIKNRTDWLSWAKGRKLRLGSYGDPAKVLQTVLKPLIDIPEWLGVVGYTRQWHHDRGPWLKGLVMASVFSEEEQVVAMGRGWRTFRGLKPGESPTKNETYCPATDGTQCADCMGCGGGKGKGRVIDEH